MMERGVHTVHTFDLDDERARWECSCGRGGSAPIDRVDLASDRHIREQDGWRVDTSRSFD